MKSDIAPSTDTNRRKDSAKAKLKLLVNGIQDNPELFQLLSFQFKEEHYAYDNGNWGVDKNRLVPTEILLPGEIVSKIHIRPDSPLKMRKDGDTLIIEDGGAVLSEFSFLPRPNFWNYKTSHGTPTKRLAQMYGLNCLNFNIFSGCEFHEAALACQFCSVKETVTRRDGVVITKSAQELAEVCELVAHHDNISCIIITGGSYLDSDYEFDAHMDVIRAIRHKLPWGGRIRGNISLMPPRTKSKLIQLHQEGVDHPSFNLEVWPQTAFDRVCSGKSRFVGFEHILDSFRSLVSCYGSGKVWCNFVAGLVPLEDLLNGFNAIAEMGVVPGANVFHPEVGSYLGNTLSSPNEDFILRTYSHAAEVYHRFGYKPFFNAAVLRNSLANEVYEGLL
ncbi:MAG: hypothetical protein JZU65_21345 [Chlorobium sp.]|nr:hypothetical protein [Chlorobium sp.]